MRSRPPFKELWVSCSCVYHQASWDLMCAQRVLVEELGYWVQDPDGPRGHSSTPGLHAARSGLIFTTRERVVDVETVLRPGREGRIEHHDDITLRRRRCFPHLCRHREVGNQPVLRFAKIQAYQLKELELCSHVERILLPPPPLPDAADTAPMGVDRSGPAGHAACRDPERIQTIEASHECRPWHWKEGCLVKRYRLQDQKRMMNESRRSRWPSCAHDLKTSRGPSDT